MSNSRERVLKVYPDAWDREFDAILYRDRNGVQMCDLSDDDIPHIVEMKDMGFTAQEAFDVLMEVQDVE